MIAAMEITNISTRPVKVSLPGGKRLFLGPRVSGQITPKTADFPAVKALIDEGVLELKDPRRAKGKKGSGGGGGVSSSQDGGGAGGMRHTGDR